MGKNRVCRGCNPFAKESEGCALRKTPPFKMGWGRSPQATRRGESIAIALRSKCGVLLQVYFLRRPDLPS